MESRDLRQLIKAVSGEVLRQAGLQKKYISQAEAFKTYGRGKVERWVRQERVTPFSDGGNTKKRYDPLQLEIAANRNNWVDYI
ncbi:MAG: hypothetical protein WCR72_01890 [Bacteroidota bacterium]